MQNIPRILIFLKASFRGNRLREVESYVHTVTFSSVFIYVLTLKLFQAPSMYDRI